MIKLKTNPCHRFYINFVIKGEKIYLETIHEPSLTSKCEYGMKNKTYEHHISDEYEQTYSEFIVPMMKIFKEIFPNEKYNADEWIEKCENTSHHFNYFKNKNNESSRRNKIYSLEYIVLKNKLSDENKELMKTKIEKAKSVRRVKEVISDYNKYIELKKQFNNS